MTFISSVHSTHFLKEFSEVVTIDCDKTVVVGGAMLLVIMTSRLPTALQIEVSTLRCPILELNAINKPDDPDQLFFPELTCFLLLQLLQ